MSNIYTILAVDDEKFNLDLIEAVFSDQKNVKLYYATSGKEAIEILKQYSFDVILLDISMPIMNGIQTLKKIKKDKKLQNIPVLMVTANHEKEYEALSIGANDFITKPYDTQILATRTINYARMHKYTKQIQNQNEILEQKVKQRTKKIKEALSLAKKTELEISNRLGLASEYRDLETGGHIKRMSQYSQLLASLYGLDEEECELILYASPLHDIGKVGIRDDILLKPGRFNDKEFEIMKQHSIIGGKILEGADNFPILKAGKIIALQHHEKYDGTGYPNGLKGDEIHLYAKIVAIADVFDALNSKRCYKDPMPLHKVLKIIQESAGSHFDPKLTKLFLDNIDKFLEIKNKYNY